MKIATGHLQFLSLRENTRVEAGNVNEHVKANNETTHRLPFSLFSRTPLRPKAAEWSPILILRGMRFFMIMASGMARGRVLRTSVAFHDILT